ncbi:MAG: efflux RND transporter periplasmic adaptor subunit [Ardenticatenaceae bacterium]|nr:efflux RND transporter periplasmic adaptor subunit [Ardenticatenaceae bacterium]
MTKFLNWKWITALITILLIGGFFLFRNGGAGTEAAAFSEEDVVTVFIGDLAASATASGQIEARQRSSLSVSGSAMVEEVLVRVGDEVSAGDVLVQLDTADLALNLTNAELALRSKEASLTALLEPATELEIAAAEADLVSAQAAYDDLLDGPSAEEIAISQASVTQANASLYSSSASLNDTANSISQADIEAAKAAVVAAEFDLEEARETNEKFAIERTDEALRAAEEAYAEAAAKYNRLLAGVDSNDLNASQADVAAAAARSERSQADLDELLLGPTAAEIASAEYTLAQAQSAWETLLEGPSAEEITIAEAEVTQAQLDLEDAQEQLANASLTAPFDGVITAVNYDAGEIASGIAVEIINLNTLEVVLSVDEVDLSAIAIGQDAEITLETWPTVAIDSQVFAISPSATDDGTGIVAYEVHVGLGETDLPVKIGMTADANLIVSERPDVLLIPNEAIRADRQSGQFFVNVIQGETVTEVEITIGLRDNSNTQIISGLSEGDQLVIDYQAPTIGPGELGGGPFGN